MNRFSNPDAKFVGLHFEDPWKEWLNGSRKREESTRDAMELHNEVYNARNELFPVRSVPVESDPGYVTHDNNFFNIKTVGRTISKELTEYFTDKHNKDNSISYSNAHDLGEFFEFTFHNLLVDGISTYAIEWEEVKLDSRTYILPQALLYVNPVTLKFTNFSDYIAKQKFSWIAKLLNTYYDEDHKVNYFRKDELIVFKHPILYPSSPVTKSLKYLKGLKQGIKFGLWQGKGYAEPTNHNIKVEWTRYKHSADYIRKQQITRVKVRRIFNQPIGQFNLDLTTFYQVYVFAEYKKHLNVLRDYLVEEFNKQLLSLVKAKNNIKSPLILEYRGFASNETIEKAFYDFKKRMINVDSFSEAVKDDYNKKLF